MKIPSLIGKPLSWLYGFIVNLRNSAYNLGILKSTAFRQTLIGIGNLSVGGTGKTPHTEYLVKLLTGSGVIQGNQLAILSRGYGRRTKGFVLGDMQHTANELGDEPLQFRKKFTDIQLAVCERRVEGVKRLLVLFPQLEIILLDDVFQHRAVTTDIMILLTDYNKLYTADKLLPVGRLREPARGSNRANIIIVTRCPEDLRPLERKHVLDCLKPESRQQVFFSGIHYMEPRSVFQREEKMIGLSGAEVLLVTGVANPDALVNYLNGTGAKVKHLSFADHHQYTLPDVGHIRNIFDNFADQQKLIITTEKDAMRFQIPEIAEGLKDLPIYYIPIEIKFRGGDAEQFNTHIINHVRKNQVNSRLYQK